MAKCTAGRRFKVLRDERCRRETREQAAAKRRAAQRRSLQVRAQETRPVTGRRGSREGGRRSGAACRGEPAMAQDKTIPVILGPPIMGGTATGIRRMFMISPHILRISFVQLDMRHDGREEQRVSGHMDCDISQAPAIIALMRQGLADLVEQPGEAVPARSSMSAH
jgi:hypothetical protein